MKIISCDKTYAAQILDIFNDAILNSTALYDYQPRTCEAIETWFELKAKGNYPIIGIVNEQGQLMGFEVTAFSEHGLPINIPLNIPCISIKIIEAVDWVELSFKKLLRVQSTKTIIA